MPELVTIRSKRGGVPLTVAREEAARFQALLDGFEENGYPLKADQSGGYNNRNIAGTNVKSQHASGKAADLNWSDNMRGEPWKPGDMPPFLADSLARRNGLEWGGRWKNPDNMHFEVAKGAPPASNQSLTQFAGLSSAPQKPAGAFSSPKAIVPPAAPAASGAFTAAVKPPVPPPAGGGAFSQVGSVLGQAGQSLGGNPDEQAAMAKINADALSEEEKRAQQAFAFLLQKRKMRGV